MFLRLVSSLIISWTPTQGGGTHVISKYGNITAADFFFRHSGLSMCSNVPLLLVPLWLVDAGIGSVSMIYIILKVKTLI